MNLNKELDLSENYTMIIQCNTCGNTTSTAEYIDEPDSTAKAKESGYVYTSEGILGLKQACPACQTFFTGKEECWDDAHVSVLIPENLVEQFKNPHWGFDDTPPIIKEEEITTKEEDYNSYEDEDLFAEQLETIKKSKKGLTNGITLPTNYLTQLDWPIILKYIGLVGVIALVIFGIYNGFRPRPFEGTVYDPQSKTSIDIKRWASFYNDRATSVPFGSEYRNISVLRTYKEETSRRETTEVDYYKSNTRPKYKYVNDCSYKKMKQGASSTTKKVCTDKKVPDGTETVKVPVYKTEPVYTTYYRVQGEKLNPYRTLTNDSYEWGIIPNPPEVPTYYRYSRDYTISLPYSTCTLDVKGKEYLDNIPFPCTNLYRKLTANSKLEGTYSIFRGVNDKNLKIEGHKLN